MSDCGHITAEERAQNVRDRMDREYTEAVEARGTVVYRDGWVHLMRVEDTYELRMNNQQPLASSGDGMADLLDNIQTALDRATIKLREHRPGESR